MTQHHETPRSEVSRPQTSASGEEESPQNLPPKAWVTLILFAAFVVAFGTCASAFMFR